MTEKIQIDRKDQPNEVIDKVNEALQSHNLVFEYSEEGEDTAVFTLRKFTLHASDRP